ncbi:MAG: hypothetical protein FJY92_09580 [Candidatus Hydrogenedentes bacterium]|nr:hypothetical protein [Candidatus Hydrogenedentota bacterium]
MRAADGYVIDAPKAEAVVNGVDPREGAVQAIEDACGKIVDDAKTAIALGALSGAPANALLVTIVGVASGKSVDDTIAAIARCLGADKHEVIFQDAGRTRARFDFAGDVRQLVDCLPAITVPAGRLALKTVVDRDVTLVVDKQ